MCCEFIVSRLAFACSHCKSGRKTKVTANQVHVLLKTDGKLECIYQSISNKLILKKLRVLLRVFRLRPALQTRALNLKWTIFRWYDVMISWSATSHLQIPFIKLCKMAVRRFLSSMRKTLTCHPTGTRPKRNTISTYQLGIIKPLICIVNSISSTEKRIRLLLLDCWPNCTKSAWMGIKRGKCEIHPEIL